MAGLLPDIRSIPRQSRPPRPVGIKVAPVALLLVSGCKRPKATRAPAQALVIPDLPQGGQWMNCLQIIQTVIFFWSHCIAGSTNDIGIS